MGKRGRFTEVSLCGSGVVQGLLEMLVFSPINDSIAIGACHQGVASNQFIECLWGNIHMADLTHTSKNGTDGLPCLVVSQVKVFS